MNNTENLKPAIEPAMRAGHVRAALPRTSEEGLAIIRARLSPEVFGIFLETVNNIDNNGRTANEN